MEPCPWVPLLDCLGQAPGNTVEKGKEKQAGPGGPVRTPRLVPDSRWSGKSFLGSYLQTRRAVWTRSYPKTSLEGTWRDDPAKADTCPHF